jgi:IPT/TIG domain
VNRKNNQTLLLIALLAVGIGCGYSKPKSAMPTISQLNPASAAAGGAQFQLEVDGSNFASGAVINFNGVVENTTVMNSSTLVAMIPATAIMTAATVPVTVTNPASTGMYGTGAVTSAAMNFTIN